MDKKVKYHPANCCGKLLPGIRRWCNDNPTCRAKKKAAQKARSLKLIRERRAKYGYESRKSTTNPCRKCGKDKGLNVRECQACVILREDPIGQTIYEGGTTNPSDLRWTPLPSTSYPGE